MIQLAVLDDAADDPVEVRQLTGELRDGLHAALDDLRALARGPMSNARRALSVP